MSKEITHALVMLTSVFVFRWLAGLRLCQALRSRFGRATPIVLFFSLYVLYSTLFVLSVYVVAGPEAIRPPDDLRHTSFRVALAVAAAVVEFAVYFYIVQLVLKLWRHLRTPRPMAL